MSEYFKEFLIDEDQLKIVIQLGLKYNPTPWMEYGDVEDQILNNVRSNLRDVLPSRDKDHLFSGITYFLPSTIILFTKVFISKSEGYSDDVVRLNFLYQPPTPSNYVTL